jgi:hypothetical protein
VFWFEGSCAIAVVTWARTDHATAAPSKRDINLGTQGQVRMNNIIFLDSSAKQCIEVDLVMSAFVLSKYAPQLAL